jgi:hypothetical protein
VRVRNRVARMIAVVICGGPSSDELDCQLRASSVLARAIDSGIDREVDGKAVNDVGSRADFSEAGVGPKTAQLAATRSSPALC